MDIDCPMDRLTAECFFSSVHCAFYQATMRSLSKEELIELTKTLQLIMHGFPGDGTINEKAKSFCVSVYASGIFHKAVDPETLRGLMKDVEGLQALLQFTAEREPSVTRSVRFSISSFRLAPSSPPQ